MKNTNFPRNFGFTLIEMAIVLTIVGLLISTLLLPLSKQREMNNYSETKKILEEIKEALIGYAVANGRLPCPDNDEDGVEEFAAGQCRGANYEGTLPYRTLGVRKLDNWNNFYGYRVSQSFAETLSLSSSGDITVNGRGDNPNTVNVIETKFIASITTSAAAVIVSYGKNGYGAAPSMNVDETTNATQGKVKLSRVHTDKSDGCSDTDESKSFCEFDDIIDWVSPNVLFNRMVAAGKLP